MLCQETTETDTVLNKDPENENKGSYQEDTETITTPVTDCEHGNEEAFWDAPETITGVHWQTDEIDPETDNDMRLCDLRQVLIKKLVSNMAADDDDNYDQLVFDTQWNQGTPRGTSGTKPTTPPQRHSPIPNNARTPPGFQQQEFNEPRNVAALNIGPSGMQLGGVAENLEALLPMARGNPSAMLDLPLTMMRL